MVSSRNHRVSVGLAIFLSKYLWCPKKDHSMAGRDFRAVIVAIGRDRYF